MKLSDAFILLVSFVYVELIYHFNFNFIVTDKHFPDKLSAYLVQHVKSGNEKDKATALVILSHLASAGHASHLTSLVTAVGSLVDDPSLKVSFCNVRMLKIN